MFFIPSNIEQLQVRKLPLSSALRAAFGKIEVRRLGDLVGLRSQDIDAVSKDGSACLKEIEEILLRARRGDFERPRTIEDRARDQPQPGDRLSVPDSFRSCPLSDFQISSKLGRILEAKGYKTIGELDGLLLSKFDVAGCGPKTLGELLSLVEDPKAKLNPGSLQTLTRESGAKLRCGRVRCLYVGQRAAELSLTQLPLSTRLFHVLKSLHVKRLADINGMPVEKLRKQLNCDQITINEMMAVLESANRGEFDLLTPEESAMAGRPFIRLINRSLSEETQRNRQILLLRFGSGTEKPGKLREVASAVGLSGERVRQIEEKWLSTVLRFGGEILTEWLVKDPRISETDLSNEMARPAPDSFYHRVLQRLATIHGTPN